MTPLGRRWRALRIISVALRVIAWIVLGVGVVVLALWLARIAPSALVPARRALPPRVRAGATAVGSPSVFGSVLRYVLGFLVLYALGEGILVLLAIEENTRGGQMQPPVYMPPRLSSGSPFMAPPPPNNPPGAPPTAPQPFVPQAPPAPPPL